MAKKETGTSGSKKPDYFFLRLPEKHRKEEKIRRLIHRAGYEGYGIYMALLEMAVPNGGYLDFCHDEDTIEEQIAFDLGIEPEKVNGIITTLEKLGLVERIEENPQEDDPGGLFFREGAEYTTSETPGAARQRRYNERKRARESERASQNDGQASQNDGQASQNDDNKNKSKNENSELEQEARIRPLASNEVNSYSLGENPAAACAGAAGAAPPPPASSPFLEKIRKLNSKKKTHRLTEAGLEAFAKETNEGAEIWGNPIEPDGLPKALNGWAKKMSEKGKHPEFFDDGAGQNAAAPGGAGQDHAGQDHAEQNGTSAGPGKAAPDQGGGDQAGSNQAGNSTSAETAAKEKELKKRIAELVKECQRIEAAPREKVCGLCTYEDAGNCKSCWKKEDCEDQYFDKISYKVSDLALTIFDGSESEIIPFFCPVSSIPYDEVKEYAANCKRVYFPKAGTIVLDDPYFAIQSKTNFLRDEWKDVESVKALKKYYQYKPHYGIPEAIARHELNMPLPADVELMRLAEEYDN